MFPKLIAIRYTLLLALFALIVTDGVFLRGKEGEFKTWLAYAEVTLALILVLFYLFTVFYRHLCKPGH